MALVQHTLYKVRVIDTRAEGTSAAYYAHSADSDVADQIREVCEAGIRTHVSLVSGSAYSDMAIVNCEKVGVTYTYTA